MGKKFHNIWTKFIQTDQPSQWTSIYLLWLVSQLSFKLKSDYDLLWITYQLRVYTLYMLLENLSQCVSVADWKILERKIAIPSYIWKN